MDDARPAPRRGGPPGGQVQQALTVGGNMAWALYRTFLSGIVTQVVPDHTRDAAFQLFCDLRCNTPKDRRFLTRHVTAFTPTTPVGWLALAATLGYSASAALLLSTATIGLSITGLSALLLTAVSAAAFLGSALALLAVVLFFSALTVGAVSFVALAAYMGLCTSLAAMRYLNKIVFGTTATAPKASLRPKQPRQLTPAGTVHPATEATAAAEAAVAEGGAVGEAAAAGGMAPACNSAAALPMAVPAAEGVALLPVTGGDSTAQAVGAAAALLVEAVAPSGVVAAAASPSAAQGASLPEAAAVPAALPPPAVHSATPAEVKPAPQASAKPLGSNVLRMVQRYDTQAAPPARPPSRPPSPAERAPLKPYVPPPPPAPTGSHLPMLPVRPTSPLPPPSLAAPPQGLPPPAASSPQLPPTHLPCLKIRRKSGDKGLPSSGMEVRTRPITGAALALAAATAAGTQSASQWEASERAAAAPAPAAAAETPSSNASSPDAVDVRRVESASVAAAASSPTGPGGAVEAGAALPRGEGPWGSWVVQPTHF